MKTLLPAKLWHLHRLPALIHAHHARNALKTPRPNTHTREIRETRKIQYIRHANGWLRGVPKKWRTFAINFSPWEDILRHSKHVLSPVDLILVPNEPRYSPNSLVSPQAIQECQFVPPVNIIYVHQYSQWSSAQVLVLKNRVCRNDLFVGSGRNGIHTYLHKHYLKILIDSFVSILPQRRCIFHKHVHIVL